MTVDEVSVRRRFVPGTAAEALIEHATCVKVDVLHVPPPDVTALARRLPKGVSLLADKVETADAHGEGDVTEPHDTAAHRG